MDPAEDFRRNAERCLKLARDAVTSGIQGHWIDMAQQWLDLARFAETGPAAAASQSRNCSARARRRDRHA